MTISEDFEKMYADLNTKSSDNQRAYYLRNKAREANSRQDNRSQYLLMYIWEIYNRSLWQINWDNDVQYETLQDWVSAEISPVYNSGNSQNILADVVRVITRIFNYTNQRNVRDKNGNAITPKYLTKNVGIGRLKIVSNYFKDDIQPSLCDEILIALTLDYTDNELKARYSESRIPPINSVENFHPNTGTDIFIFGLDEKQISAIRTALQKFIIQRHNIILSPTNREEILKLLPTKFRIR